VALPHRAPLALAQIRPEEVPVAGVPQAVLQMAETGDPRPLRSGARSGGRGHRGPPWSSSSRTVVLLLLFSAGVMFLVDEVFHRAGSESSSATAIASDAA